MGDLLELCLLLGLHAVDALLDLLDVFDLELDVLDFAVDLDLAGVQELFLLDQAVFRLFPFRFFLLHFGLGFLYLVLSFFLGFIQDPLSLFFGSEHDLLDLKFHGASLAETDDPSQEVSECNSNDPCEGHQKKCYF